MKQETMKTDLKASDDYNKAYSKDYYKKSHIIQMKVTLLPKGLI